MLKVDHAYAGGNGYRLIARGVRATDADMREICDIPNVVFLELHGCELPGSAFSGYAGTNNLQRVWLDRCIIPPKALEDIGKIKSINWLRVEGQEFNDASLQSVAKGLNVRYLHITGTSVGDAGVAAIKEVQGLRECVIISDDVTSAGLATTSQALRDITSLHLKSDRVDDALGDILKQCDKLENISLTGTKMTDKLLAEFARLPNLKFLAIGGTGISREGGDEFAKKHPKIIVLR
jgi:hypothetical protein